MRIALVGPTGQLGFELSRVLPEVGETIPLARPAVDLMSPRSVRETLAELRPELIVNAAAYTDVERAEDDEATCFAINEAGPALLADHCAKTRAVLLHYSTDYVFDGTATSPYKESDSPRPINAYGRSKLAGERAIEESGADHLIFRCSWIYSARRKNFVTTILRLAREKPVLSIVDDQVGSPTWARSIAATTVTILKSLTNHRPVGESLGPKSGTYHMAPAGATSWYDFAAEILRDESLSPEYSSTQLQRTSSQAFGARAARPAYSALDTSKLTGVFGTSMEPWLIQLRNMMRSHDFRDALPVISRPN